MYLLFIFVLRGSWGGRRMGCPLTAPPEKSWPAWTLYDLQQWPCPACLPLYQADITSLFVVLALSMGLGPRGPSGNICKRVLGICLVEDRWIIGSPVCVGELDNWLLWGKKPTSGVIGAVRENSHNTYVLPPWTRLAKLRPSVYSFWASGSPLSVTEGKGRYVAYKVSSST